MQRADQFSLVMFIENGYIALPPTSASSGIGGGGGSIEENCSRKSGHPHSALPFSEQFVFRECTRKCISRP